MGLNRLLIKPNYYNKFSFLIHSTEVVMGIQIESSNLESIDKFIDILSLLKICVSFLCNFFLQGIFGRDFEIIGLVS